MLLLLELPLLIASGFLIVISSTGIIKADEFTHISLLVFLFGIFGCVISIRNIKTTQNRRSQ